MADHSRALWTTVFALIVICAAVGLLATAGYLLVGVTLRDQSTVPDVDTSQYPFQRIDGDTDGVNSFMELYAYNGPLDPQQLAEFCELRTQAAPTRYDFFFITIFDDRRFADYPNNPFTSGYALTQTGQREHIRAVWAYSRLDGTRELLTYEKNLQESPPESIPL